MSFTASACVRSIRPFKKGITHYLCKNYNIEELIPNFITVFGLFMLAVRIEKLQYGLSLADLNFLDGKGLLVGIFVSIVTVEIYRFLKSKNFGKIKMPDSVPASLSETFASLSIAVLIMFLYLIMFIIFHNMDTTFAMWLSSVIAPQIKATDSLWFILLMTFIINAAWFFGIHNATFWGLMGPIMMMNISANAGQLSAGMVPTAILTEAFWIYFVCIGGVGSCLSLAILLCFSKAKLLKIVGKVGIIPAFFGISEPITFGLPMMLNPIFFVPCSLVSVVNAIIAFLCLNTGLIGKTYAMLSFNMPSIFGAYFSTGDFKAVILVAILIVIDMILYFPFMKIYEKQQLRIEQQDEAQAG
ncbi:PTS transporter subunit EIIC [[Clostridium] innocuum]|nr:PTS transporter subunit EIIC [[Clostridium] innocuum]